MHLPKCTKLQKSVTELAAAPELIVEAVLSNDGVSPLLKPSLAPVHIPPGDIREQTAGIGAGSIDLRQILPSGRCQCGGEHVEAVLRGVSRSPFEPELETFLAARTPLRLLLQPPRHASPRIVVIVIIDDVQPGLLGIADALVQPLGVFSLRENVRVTVKDDRSYAVIYKTFHYSGGTGGAAGMKQQAAPRH